MNLEKVFNFIKEKRGYDYPVIYKLLNGIPLSDDDLNVKDDLDLGYSDITSLPDNLKVGGSLALSYTDITSLPNNLTVGGDLDLIRTKITSLPDNLKVGGYLFLDNTPLSKRYSKNEVRKMIEDRGGFVKWSIFV